MSETTLINLITSLSENLLMVVLAYAWMAERRERQDTQDKFYRTLMAIGGYKTNPDTADVVPSDESADHNQRITKKVAHLSQEERDT